MRLNKLHRFVFCLFGSSLVFRPLVFCVSCPVLVFVRFSASYLSGFVHLWSFVLGSHVLCAGVFFVIACFFAAVCFPSSPRDFSFSILLGFSCYLIWSEYFSLYFIFSFTFSYFILRFIVCPCCLFCTAPFVLFSRCYLVLQLVILLPCACLSRL